MKNSNTQRLLVSLLLFSPFSSRSTTIVPFHDLGEMANASTLVVQAVVGESFEVTSAAQTYFHTEITVNFVVKGNVAPNASLELEHFSTKGEGWVNVVAGDVELTEGATYLLFLVQNNRGYWRPILMTYGIFEQVEDGSGKSFLVPLPEWADLNIIHPSDGEPIEPLAVYRQNEVLFHLQQTVEQAAVWNMQQALETTDVASFLQPIGFRAPPAHCTFFSIRWLDFPGTTLPVRTPTAGDPSCTIPNMANSYVAGAVANMSANYLGINLSMGETYSGFVPDCSDGTAAGNDFNNYVNANLGGPRNLVVIYNDPCNQLGDLSGCSGILGLGGVSGTSPTYTFDGLTYFAAQYGYVIVNNNVCSNCSASTYTLMLTHEMTHSLGVGHIAGSGTANMNPSCCIPITNLDQQCLNYFYPLALPVELVDFIAKPMEDHIELTWKTSSEINNKNFAIERSSDGQNFETLAQLPGAENTLEPQHYQHTDRHPNFGMNYYRLRQTDFEGTFTFSEVIAVVFSNNQPRFKAVVNPVTNGELRLMLESGGDTFAEIQIIDLQGRLLLTEKFQTKPGLDYLEIPFLNVPSGHYLAKLIMGNEVRMARFVKT